MMLDRETIIKRFLKISPQLATVFAIRAAIRVLPAMAYKAGNNEPFDFWEEDQRKQMFSIMQALRVASYLVINRGSRMAKYADDTVQAAFNASNRVGPYRACRASNAAAFCVHAARLNHSVAAYVNAIHASVAAADTSENESKQQIIELNIIAPD
ncbi:MAG: hypothetical protein Q7T85_03020, partial [Nitrosomonas sp.]|nr:hypothetical protein [Nitrosomonas sp.]